MNRRNWNFVLLNKLTEATGLSNVTLRRLILRLQKLDDAKP